MTTPPSKHTDDTGVNIPGPAEQRWVVAVLNVGVWPYQEYSAPELIRTLDPKTGEAASRYDAETWADFDRARNACGTKRFKDDGHELGMYKNRPVFVDENSLLRYPDGKLVPESAEGA